MATRTYDLVLYGASGFTGRQAVEYCRRSAPAGLRWAIAGRSASKLAEANTAGVAVVVADGDDDEALDRLTAGTAVVASTAGPFSRYGTKLVDACVRNRTHYCDITGETPWVRRLIDRHHAAARADGTRIVPCCGFDSVPSDFGAWLMSRHIRDALGADCVGVAAYVGMDGGGGLNGGTLASAIYMAESGQAALTVDPFLLAPDRSVHSDEDRRRSADPVGVRFDRDIDAWVTPFVMGPINTRVVRRTQALQATRYAYQEFSRFKSRATATLVAGGVRVFDRLLHTALGRRCVQAFLPRPGEGPSEAAMDGAFFVYDFVGTTSAGEKVRGVFRGQGDPGNRITVKCLCEAAFLLAAVGNDGDARPGSGGVLTPVTGVGAALLPRLEAAGITFEVRPPVR